MFRAQNFCQASSLLLFTVNLRLSMSSSQCMPNANFATKMSCYGSCRDSSVMKNMKFAAVASYNFNYTACTARTENE